MSLLYSGDNVTCELDDDLNLTLRHNNGPDITDTIRLSEQSWTHILSWIKQKRKEHHADAHRLLGPYSVL